MEKVQYINPSELKVSDAHLSIYGNEISTEYSLLYDSIKKEGIITPLIIDPNNFIISGTLRWRIAIELDISVVPVLVCPAPLEAYQIALLNTGRVKPKSVILKEYKLLKPLFQKGKGYRSDVLGEVDVLDKSKTLGVSDSTLNRLIQIENYLIELNGSLEAEESQKILFDLDNEKIGISPTLQSLRNRAKIGKSSRNIPFISETGLKSVGGYNDEYKSNYIIYQQDSKDLSVLDDKSVQTICCSPPYFGKRRDYEIGKNQLGHEATVEEYSQNLAAHFDECKRVIKDEGSLFVNLGDNISNFQYPLAPYRFAMEMQKRSWILNDLIFWTKKNPIYTDGKRAVKCDEVIFHFVKTSRFYYDLTWIKDIPKDRPEFYDHEILYGGNPETAKPRSFFEFRDNVVKSNIATTQWLNTECVKRGIPFTHSATFPEIIPEICIRSTSQVGDLVCDLFSGTSVTASVSLVLQRDFVGFELNPNYIEQSIVRLDCLEKAERNLLLSA
jgi:site-specific DNA-methyltransferase (adenine-specific)